MSSPLRYLYSSVLAGLLASTLAPLSHADEFLALPGLWKTTYELDGAAVDNSAPKVVWHCVDEAADPWVAFAQLQDLPGMSCSRDSLQRNSTSLQWKMLCRGPGQEGKADFVAVSGAIQFDSAQHYRGWVKLSGSLMGYPLVSSAKLEGVRKAACTSPRD